MTKTAIVILPAFACLALYGRGESKSGTGHAREAKRGLRASFP